ncbi:MAG TPA: xylosidase, partial [Paludibacter sp.]
MKKINLMLSLLLVMAIGIEAQSYQKTGLGIKAKINSTDVEIQFYGPATVRVLKSPVGKAFTKESLTVVKKPQATKFTVNQQGDVVSLKSNKLKVDVDIKSGKI